jgi:hypothetical protein
MGNPESAVIAAIDALEADYGGFGSMDALVDWQLKGSLAAAAECRGFTIVHRGGIVRPRAVWDVQEPLSSLRVSYHPPAVRFEAKVKFVNCSRPWVMIRDVHQEVVMYGMGRLTPLRPVIVDDENTGWVWSLERNHPERCVLVIECQNVRVAASAVCVLPPCP